MWIFFFFCKHNIKIYFIKNVLNSVLSILHSVITSCREIQISASSSTQRTEWFSWYWRLCSWHSKSVGFLEWLAFLFTAAVSRVEWWFTVPQSQFSSFIRTLFYKAAFPFIFLGMTDHLVIDPVAWLLTSMGRSKISDVLALLL